MFPDVLRVGNREPSFRFGYSILRHLHAMSRRFDLFEKCVPIALPQACSVHPKNGRRKPQVISLTFTPPCRVTRRATI